MGCIFMSRKKKFNTKYSPEFKVSVILDMRENGLNYRETVRKYWQTTNHSEEGNYVSSVKRWERIYLTEGTEGFMIERRGRKSTGRPRKNPLPPEAESNLLDEVQRLRERNEYLEMENEYLKKLSALVRAEGKGTAESRNNIRIKAKISAECVTQIIRFA